MNRRTSTCGMMRAKRVPWRSMDLVEILFGKMSVVGVAAVVVEGILRMVDWEEEVHRNQKAGRWYP